MDEVQTFTNPQDYKNSNGGVTDEILLYIYFVLSIPVAGFGLVEVPWTYGSVVPSAPPLHHI
jgi:hypothetical protein